MEDYHKQDPKGTPNSDERWVVYRVISRYSWDRLQDMHKSYPGSSVEHVMTGTGIYVLDIPPCGAKGEEAAA